MSADEKELYFDGPHMSPTGSHSSSDAWADKRTPSHEAYAGNVSYASNMPFHMQGSSGSSVSDNPGSASAMPSGDFLYQPPPHNADLQHVNGILQQSVSDNMMMNDCNGASNSQSIFTPSQQHVTGINVNHYSPEMQPGTSNSVVPTPESSPSMLFAPSNDAMNLNENNEVPSENKETSGSSQSFGSYMNIANNVDHRQPHIPPSLGPPHPSLEVNIPPQEFDYRCSPENVEHQQDFNINLPDGQPHIEFRINQYPTNHSQGAHEHLHWDSTPLDARGNYDDILHSQGTWPATTYAANSGEYITHLQQDNMPTSGGEVTYPVAVQDDIVEFDAAAASSAGTMQNIVLEDRLNDLSMADGDDERHSIDLTSKPVDNNEQESSLGLSTDPSCSNERIEVTTRDDNLETRKSILESIHNASNKAQENIEVPVGEELQKMEAPLSSVSNLRSPLSTGSGTVEQSDTLNTVTSKQIGNESISSLSSVFTNDAFTVSSNCVSTSEPTYPMGDGDAAERTESIAQYNLVQEQPITSVSSSKEAVHSGQSVPGSEIDVSVSLGNTQTDHNTLRTIQSTFPAVAALPHVAEAISVHQPTSVEANIQLSSDVPHSCSDDANINSTVMEMQAMHSSYVSVKPQDVDLQRKQPRVFNPASVVVSSSNKIRDDSHLANAQHPHLLHSQMLASNENRTTSEIRSSRLPVQPQSEPKQTYNQASQPAYSSMHADPLKSNVQGQASQINNPNRAYANQSGDNHMQRKPDFVNPAGLENLNASAKHHPVDTYIPPEQNHPTSSYLASTSYPPSHSTVSSSYSQPHISNTSNVYLPPSAVAQHQVPPSSNQPYIPSSNVSNPAPSNLPHSQPPPAVDAPGQIPPTGIFHHQPPSLSVSHSDPHLTSSSQPVHLNRNYSNAPPTSGYDNQNLPVSSASSYQQTQNNQQEQWDRNPDNSIPPRPHSRSSAAGSESYHPPYAAAAESYYSSYYNQPSRSSEHGYYPQQPSRHRYWNESSYYNQYYNRWHGDRWKDYDQYAGDRRDDPYGQHYGYSHADYYDRYRRSYYNQRYYKDDVGYEDDYRRSHHGSAQYNQRHYPGSQLQHNQTFAGYSQRVYDNEDNRSIYSERSYHEPHETQDLYNRSYQPDQTQYNADNSWNPSYYPPQQEEPWRHVAQVTGRQTPKKFNEAHAVARFGAGGHLVLILPHPSVENQSAAVEIHSIETLLHKAPGAETLQSFPGPLSKDETHKNDVSRFIAVRSKSSSLNTELLDRASATLMWDFLSLLVRQNGSVMGTDIAELLMQGHSGDFGLIASPNDVQNQQNKTLTSATPNMSDEDEETNADEVATNSVCPSFRFRELLLYGRKKDALKWAMDSNLWGHALLLASKMDTRTHATVMLRFANSLPLNDPLQTLYQLMSGRQPASTTAVSEEGWGDWRPHLAMILSNETSSLSLHTRIAMTMGDTLITRGLVDAAHFCYLMASTPLGYYSRRTSKIVLLGANHLRTFKEFLSVDAIQRTEVYEYAISLGAASNQKHSGPVYFPPLQIYKFLHACKLLDYGMVAKAFHYCENIAKIVMQSPTSYSVTMVSQLSRIVESLRYHDSRAQVGNLHDSDLQWSEALRVTSEKMLSGSIIPMTGSYTCSTTGSEPTSSANVTPHPQDDQSESEDGVDGEEEGEDNIPNYVEPYYPQPSAQYETEAMNSGQMQPPYAQAYNVPPPQQQPHVNFYNPGQYAAEQAANSTPQNMQVNEDLSRASLPMMSPAMQPQYHQQPPHISHEPHVHASERSVDFYGQLSSVPPDLKSRVRTSSQTSHGSHHSHGSTHRSRKSSGRRSRTTSEHSRRSRSRSASDESEKITKPPTSEAATKKKRWSIINWFTGSNKPKVNQVHLPSDSNKQITWDPEKKQWVDANATEEEKKSLPPPPPDTDAAPATTDPAAPPSLTSNRYSLKNLSSGNRSMYKDAFGSATTSVPKHTPPPSIFPNPVQGNPAMFVPNPVAAGDAQTEPQDTTQQQPIISNPVLSVAQPVGEPGQLMFQPQQQIQDQARPASEPQPIVPNFQPSQQPQYQQPGAPTYQHPGAPTYQQPGAPTYQQPGAPTYQQPGAPTYQQPGAPTYQQPETPTYQQPATQQPQIAYQPQPPQVTSEQRASLLSQPQQPPMPNPRESEAHGNEQDNNPIAAQQPAPNAPPPAVATFYNPAQFSGGANVFSQPSSQRGIRGTSRVRRGYPRPK